MYVNKEEIPVRGGDCVLCYFSSALNCIIGISEPFKVPYTLNAWAVDHEQKKDWEKLSLSQVRESRVAIEEGLLADKLNDLDLALVAEEAGSRAVKDSSCAVMWACDRKPKKRILITVSPTFASRGSNMCAVSDRLAASLTLPLWRNVYCMPVTWIEGVTVGTVSDPSWCVYSGPCCCCCTQLMREKAQSDQHLDK